MHGVRSVRGCVHVHMHWELELINLVIAVNAPDNATATLKA